jgi:hypothetical protein
MWEHVGPRASQRTLKVRLQTIKERNVRVKGAVVRGLGMGRLLVCPVRSWQKQKHVFMA